ncbi:MAG TPA: amino acid adenylation domain-containing protein [Herpetosiphonaceae bacterium]
MSAADNRSTRRSQLSPERQALLAQLKRGALAGVAKAPTIPRRAAEGPIPLSFSQQRLWFLDQLAPGSASYNMPLALALTGSLNVAALERSLNELVGRHEILRTTFVTVDGQPQQVIQPVAPLPLPLVDLQTLPEAERKAQMSQAVIAEVRRPFDLARDVLLRALLIRLAETEHVLVITSHHIVLDGSQALMMRELIMLYNAHVADIAPELPALPIQYADYALWQREWLQSERFKADLAYWQQQLGTGDLTPLDLPIARPRPPAQTFRGARQNFELSRSLADALKALSQQEDATLFMTLLAAFQCLLSRYSGQRQIAVGTPVAQRGQPELEPMIGCFVNTVVMRTDLGDNPTFREVMRRVRQVALGAYAHQQVPIEMVIEALQLERDPSRNPLYQVMFVLQHTGGDAQSAAATFSGLTARPFTVDAGTARLDLLLYIEAIGDRLLGMLEYNTDLFDATTITRLLTHFHTLLAAAVANPDRRLSDLPLLPVAEREQMLAAWNDTRAGYDRTACMHHLFERQVERTPDATAVVCGTHHLTYHDLNQQANQIAHHLIALGIGPGSMVAVWLERSHLMIPALLGILKAGATYVPLEISFPTARVQWIVNNLAVRCIITQTDQLPPLTAMQPDAPTLAHVLCLDTDQPAETLPPAPEALRLWPRAALAALPQSNPAVAVSPDDLAYVIFTSGSTGTPKGVMVRHQPVINLIEWVNHSFGVGPSDRVLFVTSLCFDLSVYDVFGLLAAGGSIRVASSQELHDPEKLLHILCTEPITFWDSAPAALNQLGPFLASAPAEGTAQLRLVFLSGDWIPVTLPDQIRGTFTNAQVISLGGATEATIWSNYYPIGAVDPQWPSIPYGRPIQNAQYYILDQQLNPCPVLVPGELYIGGECLASGYANDPILTATKFIPDPFSQTGYPQGGARLYRTGDQARFWADGVIEFLGRIDQQVKIRGFRIELGEIESVLSAHPAVQHCVVVAREDSPGDKRLVAYVGEQRNNGTKEQRGEIAELETRSSELRTYLKERLPEYMVPSAFVLLDSFPVTSNGKLDRKALPAPERDDLGATEALVAPRTPTEQLLAEIWTSVLRVQQIGIHDNFFMLGGDSILGIQIIARANQAGLRLAPGHLFQYQTIATLAAVAGTAAGTQTEQSTVSGQLPLTPIQHWFFDQQLPAPHHWNQAMLFQVPPDLDSALLARAVHHVLHHHDALRLRFTQTADGWQQVNAASVEDGWFSSIDLSSTPVVEHAAAIEATARELQASLDLADGPLIRAVHFFCGADTPGRLLLIIHHLAVDGVSWRILAEDLQASYRQVARAEAPTLPLKTTSFKQWAERLVQHAESAAVQSTLDYWLSLPWQHVQAMPLDFPHGENTEASAQTVVVRLSADETRTLLQQVPEAYRTQINEVLLTALARAVTGWSGSRSLLVHLEGHGREAIFDDLDVSRTVGWFTTIYPVLLELEATAPGPMLQAVKEQLRRIPQRGISYGLLRYLADPAITARLAALPQAEVSFNYLGQFDQASSPDTLLQRVGGAIGPLHAPQGRRSHMLEINGLVADGRLQFGWTYSAQLHRRETIEQLAQTFTATLQAMINGSQAPDAASYTPSDFPLANLSQQQLSAIAAKFNKRGRP